MAVLHPIGSLEVQQALHPCQSSKPKRGWNLVNRVMINIVGNPIAVSMYQHDTVAGGIIYVTLRTTANAINAGALFAAGWALLLAGWSGRATKVLTNVLGYVMVDGELAM